MFPCCHTGGVGGGRGCINPPVFGLRRACRGGHDACCRPCGAQGGYDACCRPCGAQGGVRCMLQAMWGPGGVRCTEATRYEVGTSPLAHATQHMPILCAPFSLYSMLALCMHHMSSMHCQCTAQHACAPPWLCIPFGPCPACMPHLGGPSRHVGGGVSPAGPSRGGTEGTGRGAVTVWRSERWLARPASGTCCP